MDRWLDENVGLLYQKEPLAQDLARISKVIEELGEALQCFIGFTGQNPRKGITSSPSEMLNEMADTMLTAVLCILHFTKDGKEAQRIIENRMLYRMTRMDEAAAKAKGN
jgi:hypothetical protein